MQLSSDAQELLDLYQRSGDHPLDPEEQNQLLRFFKRMCPDILKKLDNLEAKQADMQAQLDKHEAELFGIRIRGLHNSVMCNVWKVEDEVVRWVQFKRNNKSIPYNLVAHMFTVEDSHRYLKQLWGEPNSKQQLCNNIRHLKANTSEARFLELFSTVSRDQLSDMLALKQKGLPYALQLSDAFLIIKSSLYKKDNANITKPLQALGYVDSTGKATISHLESLEQNYIRIRNELCIEGEQKAHRKSELDQFASREKYNQLLELFKWFATNYTKSQNLLDAL
ncbi:MAG: hypothetical protein Q9181_005860 [Wetmoreana brouardii]